MMNDGKMAGSNGSLWIGVIHEGSLARNYELDPRIRWGKMEKEELN